ncbi:hypothetical protein ACE6ED_04605 [Paenibacillus sp. CN-4]|uniref:hypothetical protein n=1 Tax=Paenibacillus nanchangensis TaxID=3348343 RepID=UPI00397B3D6B
MPLKYIGCVMEIVYMDREGKLTQRRVRVNRVDGGLLRATCLETNGPRTFKLSSILAWKPVPLRNAS